LGPGAEFDRIRAIAEALGADAAGLGDDCAELGRAEGIIVASTDTSVEHVHFERNWLTLREIGHRSTAAALSDLAACGATPLGVVVAVAAPADTSSQELAELMAGAGDAARSAGTTIKGGDLSRGDCLMVTPTVIGTAERPVHRAGAKAGDGVWVTGVVGGARAALEAFRARIAPDPGARERFVAPVPRIAEGRWLAAHGARAMLDLSDGVVADAAHLAAASGVEVEIQLEQIPVHPDAVREALTVRAEPVIFAAKGGEDYELMVALTEADGERIAAEFEAAHGRTLTRIGTCHRGQGVRPMFRGSRLRLQGFDHFQ
jgi:thiamine-monophosphate kinase